MQWNLLGSVLAGENRHHKTRMIPADEAAQASLQIGKIVESATLLAARRQERRIHNGLLKTAKQKNGFITEVLRTKFAEYFLLFVT